MKMKHLSEKEAIEVMTIDPFDGDFGDQSDIVFKDNICTARKDGVCHYCGGNIYSGDQQRRMSAKFDGQLMSFRWCVGCLREMIGDQ